MQSHLQQAMNGLHTWAGLLLSTLIFAVFWMGTLSVFDREIDQWMIPDIRSTTPTELSPDDTVLPVIHKLRETQLIQQWGISMPNERVPYYRLFYQDGSGQFSEARIHARSGKIVPNSYSLGGSEFIFPFHYRLNMQSLGYWLVGLSAMAMMVLLVSGVIVHKKIFKDFFTFRPQKNLARASLDLHNLTGVVMLPFHFLITLSGLIIFMGIYFPNAAELAYAKYRAPASAFFSEMGDRFERQPLGIAAPTQASLASMIHHAEHHWQDRVGFIRVHNVGDKNVVVQLGRSVQGEVSWNIDKLYFDGVTGNVLHEAKAKPIAAVQRFFVGMHFIQFDHWPLRWLYFIGGLASCLMIGTGFLYWLAARRKSYENRGQFSLRVVEGLAIGSVTGIILAMMGFWLVNRLLPVDLVLAGIERAELEAWSFYLIWLLSFVHAFSIPHKAWGQQCAMIAGAAVLAVILNAVTTSSGLLNGRPFFWPVAGMDLLLLFAAVLATASALKLHHSQSPGFQWLALWRRDSA